MKSILKKIEAAVISKEIIVLNITKDINNKAQVEECFHIKKDNSFKEEDVGIWEFIKNFDDNMLYKEERWMHVYMKFQNAINPLDKRKINA